MSGTTYNIKIVLATNAREFGSDMGHAGDQARAAGKDIEGAGKSAGGAGKEFVSLGGLVREAAANFAGYLSAQAVFQGISKAVSFAKDTILGFDDAMTQSLAIMGDVSESTRKSMEGTARSVALQYNAAVEDVAQSYYFLASAGYDAASSQAALGQVTAFAKAGMFDMEKATELAADAQSAMGLKSDDATTNLQNLTRITDVLTKANIDANGSVEQFAEALTNKAAAGSRLAGVSLESTVAVLETFAAQGLKGKKAGEAFSIVLRDLQEKSRTNKDAFEALGITVYDAQGAFAGFPTIIGQLEKSLSGMSVEQANATLATLGFTVEGANYIKTLLGMSTEITRYEERLKSAGGATQQIAEKQMTSMVEQLKHLRAVAAELSLVGFEKLVQAVSFLAEKFGPSLQNVAKAAGDALSFIRPMVEELAKLGGGAIVGTLIAVAAALEHVTSLIAEHSGVVQALATVGLVLLVARLAQAGAAFVSMAADAAAFKAFEFAGSIDAGIASILAMRTAFRAAQAEGAGFFASMQAGFAALSLSSLAVATAGLAAFGLILYGVMTKLNDGERAADAFNKAIAQKYDQSSLKGLQASLDDTKKKMEDVGHYGSTIGERLNIGKYIEMEGEFKKLGATSDELKDKINTHTTAFHNMAVSMAEAQGGTMNTAATIQVLEAQLDAIASKEKIDPTAPGSADRLMQLADAAMFTDPTMQALHQAFTDVASASSSAEDALKAYQTALNSLIGVHISAQQAEDQFAGSLDEVHGKVTAGINLMDAYNAQNRAGREAVLQAADAAMAHAVAVYQEGGGIQAASATLEQHRQQLINTMMATGMSRQAAEAYLKQLGLIPENIQTTAEMHKDTAQAAADELTRHANEAARNRQGSIEISVSQAMANLNTLQAKLAYVSSQAQAGNLGQAGYALGRTLAGNARGSITLHQYARGGFENHVAQITPAGTVRLWGEQETGGEAYIPLGMSKRGRSTGILAAVAQMFGYDLVRYAQGGMSVSGASTSPAGIMVSPGAINVTVNNPSNGVDIEHAVGQALNAWTRAMRTEVRTRRPRPAGV